MVYCKIDKNKHFLWTPLNCNSYILFKKQCIQRITMHTLQTWDNKWPTKVPPFPLLILPGSLISKLSFRFGCWGINLDPIKNSFSFHFWNIFLVNWAYTNSVFYVHFNICKNMIYSLLTSREEILVGIFLKENRAKFSNF